MSDNRYCQKCNCNMPHDKKPTSEFDREVLSGAFRVFVGVCTLGGTEFFRDGNSWVCQKCNTYSNC